MNQYQGEDWVVLVEKLEDSYYYSKHEFEFNP